MYKISGDINVDPKGQELRLHGTLAYPIACYYNDMSIRPTIWHWHEESSRHTLAGVGAGYCGPD